MSASQQDLQVGSMSFLTTANASGPSVAASMLHTSHSYPATATSTSSQQAMPMQEPCPEVDPEVRQSLMEMIMGRHAGAAGTVSMGVGGGGRGRVVDMQGQRKQ